MVISDVSSDFCSSDLYQVQVGRWEKIEPGCVQIASPALIGGEPAQRQPSPHGTGPITQRILLEYFLDRQSASRGFHQCRQIVVIIELGRSSCRERVCQYV